MNGVSAARFVQPTAICAVTELVPSAGMLEAGSAWALPSSTPAPAPSRKRPSTACTTKGKRLGLVTSNATASVTPVPPTASTCALLGVIVGGLGFEQAAVSDSAAKSVNCWERAQNGEEGMVAS